MSIKIEKVDNGWIVSYITRDFMTKQPETTIKVFYKYEEVIAYLQEIG